MPRLEEVYGLPDATEGPGLMSKNEESTGVPKLPSLTAHLEARIQLLEDALKPFAAIADEYDTDGLDEARPDWVKRGIKQYNLDIELYCGRGGKELMTLRDVLRARSALTGKAYELPVIDPFIEKVKKLYAASLNNLAWEQMSEERRNTIVENYRKLEE